MLEIKRAELSDLATVQQLGYELLEYEKQRWDDSLELSWPFSEAGKQSYQNAIENHFVLLAFLDNTPVGYLIGILHIPPAGSARNLAMANLNNIYVKDEARGQGVGSALVANFREYCQKHQIKKINVTVNAQNEQAIRFYEQQNFSSSRLILSETL